MVDQLKESFSRELAKTDDQINLAYAALLFSEYLTGPFDNTLYLTLLDEIAEHLEPEITTAGSEHETIEAFNYHLFVELKFAGNMKNYYHPHNSLLNRVLDLRLGIPISLSVIYLELGWRLGLPLWGVGLPGHFIVAFGSEADPIYIDVFSHGRILSQDECIALAQGHMADPVKIKELYLKPVEKKSILYRMLLNLKQIYVNLEDWSTAHKIIDLMLIVNPKEISEIRDRGLIAYRLNRLQDATMDIERYLFLAPDSKDAQWLKKHLKLMEENFLRLN